MRWLQMTKHVLTSNCSAMNNKLVKCANGSKNLLFHFPLRLQDSMQRHLLNLYVLWNLYSKDLALIPV